MELLITITSIALVTLAAWLLRTKLSLNVCPPCAGVAGTWLGLLVALKLDLVSPEGYELLIASLMGGTVVGIMYKVDRLINSGLSWWGKLLMMMVGFSIVYIVLESNYWYLILIFVVPVVTLLVKLFYPRPKLINKKKASSLKADLSDCC